MNIKKEILLEYITDIFKTMQKNVYHNFKSYLNINQNYLLIRTSLFSLIKQISNKMKFSSKTYFLCLYYLDLIFLKNKVPSYYNNNYQLLGLTCLVIAAKYLENDPAIPKLQCFIKTCDWVLEQGEYNKDILSFNNAHITFDDLKLSEVIVCKILDYKLNYFTIYDFNYYIYNNAILKLEQLNDIIDCYNKKEKNNFDINEKYDDNIDLINNIMYNIYKKSKFFLEKVIEDKISLKYDSFLISIYIMYISIECVILKEYKNILKRKNEGKCIIDKKIELLRIKTLGYFKEIMNEVYKINLDSMKEYQHLINDYNFLKIFDPYKFKKKTIENNKNEFDIRGKMDKIHSKIQSNNIDLFQKNNSLDKSERFREKKFSPKDGVHMIPKVKYNKIKNLKLLEGLYKNYKTSKNKNNKLFILTNLNDTNFSKGRINTSINNKNQNDGILSKSIKNIDTNHTEYFDKSSKNKYKHITTNIDNHNDTLIESYNDVKIDPIRYETSYGDEKGSTLFDKYYFKDLKRKKEIKIYKKNLDNSVFNHKNNWSFGSSNHKKMINLKQKFKMITKNDNSSMTIRPYSKKLIPKIDKKMKKVVKRNTKINDNSQNIYINVNNIMDMDNVYRNKNNLNISSKNLDLRNSIQDQYKNNLFKTNIYNSIDFQKDYLPKINERIKLNLLNNNIKDNKINSKIYQYKKKFKDIPFLITDIEKLSKSVVHKVKVNGVSNKHKLNKKLILRMYETPTKNENDLNNVLKRNNGVKRDNNSNSGLSKNCSIRNSIEELNKDNESSINKTKHSKEYSCINFYSKKFSNVNTIESKSKIIKIKNEINKENNHRNKDLLILENNKGEISSLDKYEKYNEDKGNNFKINNIKINQYENSNDRRDNNKGKNKINKIKSIIDKFKKNNKNGKPIFKLININKKKSPMIFINNNINLNFPQKTIEVANKYLNLKNIKNKIKQ